MITYNQDRSITITGSLTSLAMFGDAILKEYMNTHQSPKITPAVRYIDKNVWMVGKTYCTEEVKNVYVKWCNHESTEEQFSMILPAAKYTAEDMIAFAQYWAEDSRIDQKALDYFMNTHRKQ